MYPYKTALARTALESRDSPLKLRERRVVILCNGRRSLAHLDALLGSETAPLVHALRDRGFLEFAGAPISAPAVPAIELAGLIAPPPAPEPMPEPAPPPPAPAPAPARMPATSGNGSRRSLVAAKMYMMGMLELQRSEEALAQRLHLQASREPDEVVEQILAALQLLRRQTTESMARRVHERLLEALPEAYLARLEQAVH